MKLFISWFISTVAIAITAYLLPGISVSGIVSAAVLAVVLGVINTFIRPVLLMLTLPLTIVTLGLFALILNTLLIMLAAALVPGVAVSGFIWALLFGIILALITSFLKSFQDE